MVKVKGENPNQRTTLFIKKNSFIYTQIRRSFGVVISIELHRQMRHSTRLYSFFFQLYSDVESGALNLTFPIMFNPVTWDAHVFPVYFGGSILTEDLTIESVPSVQLGYFITVDSPRQNAM